MNSFRLEATLKSLMSKVKTRALEQWPKDLQDQVWSDQIQLQQKLRRTRKAFQKKLELLVLLDIEYTT
jgi:hypothetical protein